MSRSYILIKFGDIYVPINDHFRVFLHKDWRGVRDEELSKIANIKDSIFCHASGFIGGNKTKDGAIAMALCSLEAAQGNKN